MKQLNEWLDRLKEKSREQRRKEISDTFQVKETGETLCIVHNGDAITDFPENTTIATVMRELKNKRETALKYAKI